MNNYQAVLELVGNTPFVEIKNVEVENINLYVKLEFMNPTGSVKDRAASYLFTKILHNNIITKDTIILESSSGNFGISLAAYAKYNDLKFCAVIDPNINTINENIIRCLAHNVIKVDEPDGHGGYLLTRINKIKKVQVENTNTYWVNQYANPIIAEAYYSSLGEEICSSLDTLDYLFIGVSSGGTITGVSKRVKETFPGVKVIAVDSIGSIIFGGIPQKRYIPGIGSSMVPSIINNAFIDEVIFVNEKDAVKECHSMLRSNYMLLGGSSGSVMHAIKTYFMINKQRKKKNVVTIFPDRGDRYINTIYNSEWCEEIFKMKRV